MTAVTPVLDRPAPAAPPKRQDRVRITATTGWGHPQIGIVTGFGVGPVDAGIVLVDVHGDQVRVHADRVTVLGGAS